MPTTQAAVKAALKVAVLARTFITNNHIQVLYGEPGDEGRRECIWIGTSFTEAPQEPRAFRKGLRLEEYTLKVRAEAGLDPTPEKAEARAVLLADEVEATIIDSINLGVANVSYISPAGGGLQSTEGDESSRAIATINLQIVARLV